MFKRAALFSLCLAWASQGLADAPDLTVTALPALSPSARAASFLSYEQLAASGANERGIPPISYAFFDERQRNGSSTHAVDWEESGRDKEGISHSCLEVERLFVIPWGWQRGQVGLKRIDVGKKEHGYQVGRQVPVFARALPGKQLRIWDKLLGRVMTLDYNGQVLASRAIPLVASQGISLEKDEAEAWPKELPEQGGQSSIYENRDCPCAYKNRRGSYFGLEKRHAHGWPSVVTGSRVTFCGPDLKAVRCRLYLPYAPDQELFDEQGRLTGAWDLFHRFDVYADDDTKPSAAVTATDLETLVDEDGDIIHFLPTDAGLEVYRYFEP